MAGTVGVDEDGLDKGGLALRGEEGTGGCGVVEVEIR